MSGNSFSSFANGNRTREFRALPNFILGKSFNLLLIVERLTPNRPANSRLDMYRFITDTLSFSLARLVPHI